MDGIKNFLIKLYANENFPIYLGCIIFVLLIAFFVIFFLGRKDKKDIEKTKELEKISFKEETKKEKVEVKVEPENKVLIEPQKIEDKNQIKEIQTQEPQITYNFFEKKAPVEDKNEIKEVETKVKKEPQVSINFFENEKSIEPQKITSAEVKPSLENKPEVKVQNTVDDSKKIENNFFSNKNDIEVLTPEVKTSKTSSIPRIITPEQASSIKVNNKVFDNTIDTLEPVLAKEKTISFPDTNSIDNIKSMEEIKKYNALLDDIDKELTRLEKAQNLIKKEENLSKTNINVYSSVYVPKKDEPITIDNSEIELPKIKEEVGEFDNFFD